MTLTAGSLMYLSKHYFCNLQKCFKIPAVALKGQSHEIFYLWFFINIFP
jgi:hypothetical protein